MEYIDYSTVVALLPWFVSKMTTHFKVFAPNPKIIPFIPYIIWVLSTVWLYFVYGGESMGIYIINWLSIALSASTSYSENKPSTSKANGVRTFGENVSDWETLPDNYREDV